MPRQTRRGLILITLSRWFEVAAPRPPALPKNLRELIRSDSIFCVAVDSALRTFGVRVLKMPVQARKANAFLRAFD